jgi:hypothetical protein
MTTASPPAPSAQVLFFSSGRSRCSPRSNAQAASRPGPSSVVREKGYGNEDSHEKDDVRVQAARVIRTTAEHWWPPEP